LRYGHPPRNDAMKRGLLGAMTTAQLLDAIAVRLRSEEVGGRAVTAHLTIDAAWTLELSNRALSATSGLHGTADVVADLPRDVLVLLSTNSTTVGSAVADGQITIVAGEASALDTLFGHLDTFQSMFPVVEP